MKNKIKLFGIITLAVIISFMTTGCPENNDATVTSVTISPATATVAKGGTQEFTATVIGTNNPAQTVTWTVTGGVTGTSIATNGTLTVSANETATTLTVKATSTVDTGKFDTATVTVTGTIGGNNNATVTSVTISPTTANVAKGGTQAFTATVIGTNSPAKTVTWTIVQTNKNSGTTINTNGVLTVAVAETLTSLTIRATSTVDNTKNGNATVTVTETSTGGAPNITTTPLSPTAVGVQTFTSNSGGNKPLTGSSYGYEMWTEGGNNNKLIWYGPNQGGGAAFRAEWTNPNDFLGRIGYYWGNGGQYTQYKNMYADFNYTRSGRSTAGNYSYIGIYGWARNPSAAKDEEKLIEYYIVEDWFGNQWQDDTSPMGTGTTGGSEVSSYTLDGATYKVIKNVRVNKPSIDGDKTFTQYFSIRQTLRKTGTISITEHFKKWDALGMKLGNMYEAKFLVEAGGGTGWLEFTYLKLSQEDNPR